jgi:hypothetical protein
MDSRHRHAIARVRLKRGPLPAIAEGEHVRGVEPANTATYGVEDIHAWIVARVPLMCQHCRDRSSPTIAWRDSRDEVRGIHVCVEVSVASVKSARSVGATLIVASVPVFGPCRATSVPGLPLDERWASTFSRHGLSCLDAPALFANPVRQDAHASPAEVAPTLSQAFPEVPVYTYPER